MISYEEIIKILEKAGVLTTQYIDKDKKEEELLLPKPEKPITTHTYEEGDF